MRTITIRLLLFCILLVSCSGNESTTSPPSAQKLISLSFGCPTDDVSVYRTLADQFELAHPDILIQIRGLDNIYFEEFDPRYPASTLQKLANEADTFFWFNLGVDQAARLNLLQDMAPWLEQNNSIRADFFPRLLKTFSYGGKVLGLPAAAEPILLFYDRSTFTEIDITPPQAGWTWQEFTMLAQRLTQSEGNEIVRYGLVDPRTRLPMAHLYSHGGRLLQGEMGNQSPFLAGNKQAEEALTWYNNLKAKSIIPDPLTREQQGGYGLITSGRAAMWTGSAASMTAWQRSADIIDIGISPLPEDSYVVHPMFVGGYVVSNGTQYPDAAWQWIEFLSKQSSSPSMSDGSVPARRSLAEASFFPELEEEHASAIRYAINQHLIAPGAAELWFAIGSIDPLLRGEQSVEEFLAEAQKKADTWQTQRLADKSTTITVATPIPRGQKPEKSVVFGVESGIERALYDALAQEFMIEHPDVLIKVQSPNRVGTIDLGVLNDKYDSYLWKSPALIESASPDQSVLDLTPYVENSTKFAIEDIAEPLIYKDHQGGIAGLPVAFDALIIHFDQATFDSAGISPPPPDWTWDTFLAYAKKMTSGEVLDKHYGYLDFGNNPLALHLYLESQNMRTTQEQNGRTKVSLNSDELRQGVQWWIDMVTVHGVMPPVLNEPWQRDTNLLNKQQVAMWSNWASRQGAYWGLEQLQQRNLGYLPMPQGKHTTARLQVWYAYISPKSDNADTAWQWIRYLSEHLPPGHLAPARLSLLNSSEFSQQVTPDFAKVYRQSLEADDIFVLGAEGGSDRIYTFIYQMWQDISKGIDLDTSLNKAQENAQAFFEESGY